MFSANVITIIAAYCALIAALSPLAQGATGIFAMAGLPLLPALLANLMALHLALWAMLRRIHIGWLAVSIAFYLAWALAASRSRIETPRAIRDMMAHSRIDSTVAADADLIFANDDWLASQARRFLVGGRVFDGSGEIQIFRSHVREISNDPGELTTYQINGQVREARVPRSPTLVAKSKCEDPAVQARAGRLNRSVPFGGDVFFECTFVRSGPAPNAGLVLTRSDEARWPGQHFVHYAIDAKSADGALKRVGHFYFGYVRTLSHIPIWSPRCYEADRTHRFNSTRWCWFEPEAGDTPYSFAGNRDLITAPAPSASDPDFAIVEALAAVLGRAVRTEPPDL